MTTAGGGEEGRRQAYLAALGIPLWASRQPLPGALPAEPLDYLPWLDGAVREAPDTAEMAEAAPVMAPPPVTAHVPAPAAAPSRAPSRPSADRLAADAAPVSPPTAGANTADTPPRFLFRVQALAPGWCAIVTLGEVPDLAAREHRLLAHIAHALGGDVVLPPCEHLHWPLNRNPALDHGAPAMVEWLAHALKLPPGRCVVFGERLAVHVRAAQPQREVVIAPLLADLLDDPLRKRAFWRSLHD